MKSLKSLMAAALFLASTSAMAQASYVDKEGNEYQFKKHLFLNLEGGAQYTFGEAKFKDLISPNVQLGLGYQFCPVFALRLQANAWQSKGGWNGYTNRGQILPSFTANYKYKYVAPGLDLMFNLSNLFCGWNPNRVFNLTAFVGGGANVAWGNEEVNDLAKGIANVVPYNLENLWDGTKVLPYGRCGLEASFRLSNAVSLLVESNANVLSDKYNSKKAGNADWYFNGLVGLRINLGKSYTKKEQPIPDPVPEPVIEEQPEPVVEPVPVVEPKAEPLRRDVFFTINSYKVRASELQKIQEIVDYLNKTPEAKVTVTGYADAGTGNDKINDRIAAQRAASVVNTLKTQYGISADRITSDSKGARVQPFAENDKNRVSICIAE